MKPRGKPFEKGTDARRTPGGRTKEQAAFSRSLKHYIVKHGEATVNVTVDGKPKKLKRIEAVVRAVYNEAIKGNLAAATFIAERVEGKVTQPLGEDPAMPFAGNTLSIFVHGDDGTA